MNPFIEGSQGETEAFLRMYEDVLSEAIEKVKERAAQGRNNIISLPRMFPRGTDDLTLQLYMKSSRIVGASDPTVLREEAIDIINYASFLVAMIDSKEPT